MDASSLFHDIASEVLDFIAQTVAPRGGSSAGRFNELALKLFSLQFRQVPIYRQFCLGRQIGPGRVESWQEIPAMPTSAFKEYEVTSLAPEERAHVFYSSGTSGQARSRHFHDGESLGVYEASLWPWFARHFIGESRCLDMLFLTPAAGAAPESSLAHMFETVRQRWQGGKGIVLGGVQADGSWVLDLEGSGRAMEECVGKGRAAALLGPAFALVHLLDYYQAKGLRFALPAGSRVMETGGYKGRSRALAKEELHRQIRQGLGIERIVVEYGMSELSSQAYCGAGGGDGGAGVFRFPPWAPIRVVSAETGAEVEEGETGVLRVFDLANVRSVMAIETEDLVVRRKDGFEYVGRAADAQPRGCSLAVEDF